MDYLNELRINWQKKQSVRWFLVTYPKTSGLVFTSFIAAYTLIVWNDHSESKNFNVGFRHSMHSDDNTSKLSLDKKILVYDSSKSN